jgi:phage shock protein A
MNMDEIKQEQLEDATDRIENTRKGIEKLHSLYQELSAIRDKRINQLETQVELHERLEEVNSALVKAYETRVKQLEKKIEILEEKIEIYKKMLA